MTKLEQMQESFIKELYERASSVTGASQYGNGTLEEQAYKHGFSDAIGMVNIDLTGTPESKGMLERLITEVWNEAIKECIELSDKIESHEPDGGTRQWMAFKAFRNGMRDRLNDLQITSY